MEEWDSLDQGVQNQLVNQLIITHVMFTTDD